MSDGKTPSRRSSPGADGTKRTLAQRVKLGEGGADEGCSGTSVNMILHVFPIGVLKCLIAMVRDARREAFWGVGTGLWRLRL